VFSGPAFFIQNPELVQELQVVTNQFSAENSRNAGATVTVITKRGTNQIHGGIFWRHHNDSALGTTTARQSQLGVTKPSFDLLNEWGFGVAAPSSRTRCLATALIANRAPAAVCRWHQLIGLHHPRGIETLAAAGISSNTLDILRGQNAFAPNATSGNPAAACTHHTTDGFSHRDPTNTFAFQTLLGCRMWSSALPSGIFRSRARTWK
jgi:hypothetical protein